MNSEILKLALAETSEEKLLGGIPENLPKAELSEKIEKRINNILRKKKARIGFIAAAVAVIILATPIIVNQLKPLEEIVVESVTPETHTVSKNTTRINNKVTVDIDTKDETDMANTIVDNKVEPTIKNTNNGESVIKEDDLVIDIEDKSNTTKNNAEKTTELTHSKEYQDNLMNGSKQLSVLKSIKGFDDYYSFYDEKGRLNILYWDDESLEIMKKYLDSTVVIFKKVKFSKDYLSEIHRVLSENKEKFDISVIGIGNRNNQVMVMISDESRKKDILEFLNKNIENFDEKAVDIIVCDGEIVEG